MSGQALTKTRPALVPACPSCGSRRWVRLVQYMETLRQDMGASDDGTRVWTDENSINVDAFEVVEGWECENDHQPDDETDDLLDEAWDA